MAANKIMATVGWREWVSLPDFSGARIKAKIDTGALTSSIHASDVVVAGSGPRQRVSFMVHPKQDSNQGSFRVKLPLAEMRWVRSSNGQRSLRPVIKTTLKIGDTEHEIELNLVNRDVMGFRMLIGRKALKGNYLVDPGRSFLLGKALKKKKKKLRKKKKVSKKS